LNPVEWLFIKEHVKNEIIFVPLMKVILAPILLDLKFIVKNQIILTNKMQNPRSDKLIKH